MKLAVKKWYKAKLAELGTEAANCENERIKITKDVEERERSTDRAAGAVALLRKSRFHTEPFPILFPGTSAIMG